MTSWSETKNGQRGTSNESTADKGPSPDGWYHLSERTAWSNDGTFLWRKTGGYYKRSGNIQSDRSRFPFPLNRKSSDHRIDRAPRLFQGGYSLWKGNIYGTSAGEGHISSGNQRIDDPVVDGDTAPTSVHFKFDVNPDKSNDRGVSPSNKRGRSALQIHPDGHNDGTLGCIGLQRYQEAIRVEFLMRHLRATGVDVRNQPTNTWNTRLSIHHLTLTAMKIIILTILILTSLAQADDYEHPEEYIKSELQYLQSLRIGRSEGIDDHIAKFQNLKSQLPASEAAFRGLIDGGIAALQKIKNDTDDSMLADLSALGVKYANYYLANKQVLDAAPESELTQAYYAFLGRAPIEGGGPPHRFFQYLLDGLFYSYLNYYNLEEFDDIDIPNYAKKAMVDSLSWVTESGDDTGEGHFNSSLIYYFSELWHMVSPKLDTLSASQRELVFAQLESALEENDQFDDEIESKAQQHLAAARVRFPKN